MRIQNIFILLFIAFVTVSGCKKPQEYPIGDPYSQVEGIQGTFRLAKVEQVDELTLNLNKTLDVSELYLGTTPMEVTFGPENVTVNANDTPDYFTTGSTNLAWSFDDNTFPTKVIINNGEAEWDLLRPIRTSDNELAFKVSRFYRGKKAITYNFSFQRQ
ncbi:MAG: DUF5004 domain-containing protein [Bacteroidia bacterium]|nr:DUF5004 domain-containing protein [Bacteroidia bacterium]